MLDASNRWMYIYRVRSGLHCGLAEGLKGGRLKTMETKIVYEYVSDKASELRKTRHYKNMDSFKRVGCDLLYGSICIIEGAQYLLNVAAESLYKLLERIAGGGH